MPDTKVGKLDHPERYGRRSMAVYSNSNGLYFIHDGVREDVHGNQLWTTVSNVKVRGESPVSGVPAVVPRAYAAPTNAAADFDQNELSAAIAASLAESPYDINNENDEQIDPPSPLENGEAASGEAASVNSTCLICLTDPAVMLMRPCNHLAACQSCSRRLLRNPCVACRRNVSSIERIF